MHEVTFEYRVKEGYAMELDLDEELDAAEQEQQAIAFIKDVFDDVEDIEIKSIRKI